MLKYLFIFCGVLLLTMRAEAAPFSALIDFGDSLSDVGNDYNLSAHLLPGGPGYFNGRFSNGPIWLEDFGQSLGLGAPTPSVLGGNDFAYGGVTSGTSTTNGVPNVQTQVNQWTTAHTATPTQLFTVLGGANDLLNYVSFLAGGSVGTAPTTPTQAADNIAASVHTLYTDGARNILVANLPDLGFTPRFRATAAQPAGSLVSAQFNGELALDLAGISATSSGLQLYSLDLNKLFNMAITNPGNYGLNDVTDQAYTNDNSFTGNGISVSNPSGYLFWDAIHPTTKGHSLIAAAALSAVPEPTSLVMIVAVTGLLSRRRRV